jgi:subtilisin family serine protease
MAKYILMNRRSGKFTPEAKIASRATVASALGLMADARIVEDHQPADELARRVVVLDISEGEVAALKGRIAADAILEPLVRRELHYRRPIELEGALPFTAPAAANGGGAYSVSITGGGAPLADIEILFYVRDASGQIRTATTRTDAAGTARLDLAAGQVVSFVEPVPYAGFWIMLAEAPPSGSAIECTPITKAPVSGMAWWHSVMGANGGDASAPRGRGVRVGVIDTGCGPHRNLAHVTLAGVFNNDESWPAGQATDVAEHGTHTSGIIGARPSAEGDYAGIAPECELFHVRVFASEEEGPNQADLVKAIDLLSRDLHCDLINMSLGGAPPSQAEEDCIRDAAERGALCLCSAGNSAGPVNYPAAYPECAAVSAIGQIGWAPPNTFSFGNRPREAAKLGQNNLFLATFSCYGPALACAAPGVGIVSTVPDRNGAGGLYMEMDGTSMASPAACGALAVMLSRDPNYTSLARDLSRYQAARQILDHHCRAFGLAVQYEGRGLPVI